MKEMLIPYNWSTIRVSEKAILRLESMGYEIPFNDTDGKHLYINPYDDCENFFTDKNIIALAKEMQKDFCHVTKQTDFKIISYDETKVVPVILNENDNINLSFGKKEIYKNYLSDDEDYIFDWIYYDDYDYYDDDHWHYFNERYSMENMVDYEYTTVLEVSFKEKRIHHINLEPTPKPVCTYQFTKEEEKALESHRQEFYDNTKKFFPNANKKCLGDIFDEWKEKERQLYGLFKEHPSSSTQIQFDYDYVR